MGLGIIGVVLTFKLGIMSNEVIFIGFALFLLGMNLLAFRAGKTYMFLLIGLYSLIMNIFVLKQFTLFGFMVTGGNALYGATFLMTDLLNEHYGKDEAYKAVGVGFLTMWLFVVCTKVLLIFTPNEFDFAQGALETLFTITPRILVGSLLAYAVAQSFDVWFYERIRKWTKEKYLFLRNNGSTLVSQFIDSVIFTAVGLTSFSFVAAPGIIEVEHFWEVTLATYFIKVIVSLMDTPFIYLSYKVKR